MDMQMSNTRFRKLALVFTLSLVMGACADSPSSPTASPASLAILTPLDAQNVAHGLALAMRDPSIRKQVQGAMRASLLNEHKLVLQDFLNTATGQEILSATAAALNLTPTSLQSTIAKLPRLDFYAPFEAHRLTWKAESDVYVAVTFDKNAPTITGFGTDGRTVTLRKDQGVPDIPLLILHPAEPTLTRNAPQANKPGDLIQDATDGAVASKYVPQGPALLIACETDPTALVCDVGGGGGGGVGAPAPGVYINHFNIKADDGWFGNSEMRFRSYAIAGWEFQPGPNGTSWYPFGHQCDKGIYSQDGVVTSDGYDGLFSISPTVTRGSFLSCDGLAAQYAIHITESDGDLNGNDDDYGWRIYAAGNYPSGTMYDPVVNSFYAETFPNGLFGPLDDASRTAYLRIIVY